MLRARFFVAIALLAVCGGCSHEVGRPAELPEDTAEADESGPPGCEDDAACDDGEACTTDRCEADGRCSHTAVEAGTSCDDGDACTTGDACATGVCAPGVAVALPADTCVTCTCDPVSGVSCSARPVGSGCDDGDCCTEGERCRACAPGQPGCNEWAVACEGGDDPCEDDDVCTDDACSCDESGERTCTNAPVADGTSCVADPNACTTGDACVAGSCVQGPPRALDDGNPCTRDSCVKGQVEHQGLNGGQCDDGNTCTTDDTCSLGACVGGPVVVCAKPTCASSVSCVPDEGCVAVWSPAGTMCDDGDACTSGEVCDGGQGCGGGARAEIDDGNPCTLDVCDPATGVVTHTPTGASCDDGDPCTSGDVCTADGGCAGSAVDCSGVTNPCLQKACNPDSGSCDLPVADGTSCADGDLCDGAESCDDGVCRDNDPIDCSGVTNPCLQKACNPDSGSCDLPVQNGTSCADGDLCDGAETCDNGVCKDNDPIDCSGVTNPCLQKACNPDSGSCDLPVADGTSCADGDLCDGAETCDDGTCRDNDPIDCSGVTNPCLQKACNPDSGSCDLPVADGTSCADGDLCDGAETCDDGVCRDNDPIDCSGVTNPCLQKACNPTSGSCDLPVQNGTSCADDDLCDGAETCDDGVCKDNDPIDCSGVTNPCLQKACNPDSGSCDLPVQNGTSCADGDLCDGAETCDDGTCKDTTPVDCSGVTNPCLQKACNPTSGSCDLPVADGTSCADGDLCDGTETCDNGVCKDNDPIDCSGVTNPCLQKACNPTSGSCDLPVADGTSCADDDLCDGAETCDDGTCKDTTPVDCSGVTNPCLQKACNPDSGSCDLPVQNGTSCADGDLCDGAETCDDGVCKDNDPIDCSGVTNPCLQKACNPTSGSCDLPVADGTSCADGDLCDGAETCDDGTCKDTTAVDCSGVTNPCLQKACNPTSGSCDLPVADGTSCADGDLCDGAETCDDGACKDTTPVDCSGVTNPCLQKTCNPTSGSCDLPVADGTSCADDDLCDGAETCDDGTCKDTTPVDCSGVTNPCLQKACNPTSGSCDLPMPNGTSCADGDLCDGAETCDDGTCKDTTPVDCSGVTNPCLQKACNPTSGSCDLPVADGTSCADGDLCDGAETCDDGTCKDTTPVDCSGVTNPCLQKACNPDSGSCDLPVADGTPCADGDLCDGAETCDDGTCKDTTPVDCSGVTNPCLQKACNPDSGSCDLPVQNGTSCADGDLCDGAETCDDGTCKDTTPVDCSGVTNPCLQKACNPDSGSCDLPMPNGTSCADGDLCDGAETCDDGTCKDTTPVDCSGVTNPCLQKACNPDSGSCDLPMPNGTSCADGDLCDGAETCDDGTCKDTNPVDCSHVAGPCTERDLARLVDGATATATSAHQSGDYPPDLALDGDLATPWVGLYCADCRTNTLEIQLAEPSRLTRYDLQGAPTERTLESFALEARDDSTTPPTWRPVTLTSPVTAPRPGALAGTFAPVTTTRLRLTITSEPRAMNQTVLYEAAFFGTACTGGCAERDVAHLAEGTTTTATGEHQSGDYPPDLALDGDPTTAWVGPYCYGCTTQSMTLTLPGPRRVSRLTLLGETGTDDPTTAYTLEIHDGTTWRALPVTSTQPPRVGDFAASFEPVIGTTFRLTVSTPAVSDPVQTVVYDFALFGTPPGCTASCLATACNPDTGACDLPVADGTSCADDDLCDGAEACLAGVCTDATGPDCASPDTCRQPFCNPATGACDLLAFDGTPCADADLCDGAEACRAGACADGTPVDCSAVTAPCLATACNPDTGACDLPLADGTPCADADLCDGAEACDDGACKDATPIDCASLGPCYTGACDPDTGTCEPITCPDDGHPCTTDVCDPDTGACGILVTSGTVDLVLQPGPDAPGDTSYDKLIGSVYDTYDPSGTYDTLRVGGWADYYYSLLRFDLAGLPPDPTAAKLWLYPYANGNPSQIYLDLVTSAWSTATRWNTRPTYTNVRTLPASTQDVWYGIDLLTQVSAWLDGSVSNWGVQLRPTGNNNNFNQFRSADHTEPALRPKLALTYDCATYPTPCEGGDTCLPVCEGTACDDGDPCTTADTCTDGVCVGSGPSCPDDGDPCTTPSCPVNGECAPPTFSCVTITDGTVAYETLPALAADGTFFTAGRNVPVNGSLPQGDLRRVGRSYALRSSDLAVLWGPLPNHANCGANAGPALPSLDEISGALYTQGDWNDGSSDFCASIFARRASDAAALWSMQPGGPHPRHPIALAPTRAFYGGNSGRVRAFDLANSGTITATLDLAVGYSEGGGIVVMASGDVIASQNGHKTERWTPTGTRVWTSTAIKSELHMTANDNVVGWSATDRGTLVYASGATGQATWTYAVSQGAGAVLTDANGHLYLGRNGAALSLDATGKLRWSTALTGVVEAQLLGDDGRFYARTPTTLYALDAATGQIDWRLDVVAGTVSIEGQSVPNRFSGYFALLADGDLFATDYAGRRYRLATDGLDYAAAPWPRPRGNRLNSGRVGHLAPLP